MFGLVILLFIWYLIYTRVSSKSFISKQRIAKISLCLTTAFILNLFWILPVLSNYSYAVTSFVEPLTQTSTIAIINDNAGLLATSRLMGYWLMYSDSAVSSSSFIFSNVWQYLSFLIPIFIIISLALNRNKKVFFFGTLSLLFIIPTIMAKYYPSFYSTLIDVFPPLSIYRDSTKFIAIVCLAYSFLMGALFEKLLVWVKGTNISRLSKKPIKILGGYILIGIICISTAIYVSPNIVSGDYLGKQGSVTPPSYWYNVSSFLEHKQSPGDYWRVMWVPPFSAINYSWNRYAGIDPVDEYLTPLYCVSLKSSNPSLNSYLKDIIPSLYIENSGLDLSKLIAPMCVKYVVLRLDATPLWMESLYPASALKNAFNDQMGFTKIYEDGEWIVYENNNNHDYFTVQPLNSTVILWGTNDITKINVITGKSPPLLLDADSPTVQNFLTGIMQNNASATMVISNDELKGDLNTIYNSIRKVYILEAEKLPVEVSSIVPNFSFEEGTSNWTLDNMHFSYQLSPSSIDGKYSLEVTTSSRSWLDWSFIASDDVYVLPGVTYNISTCIKISNVNQSHISFMGYNPTNNEWTGISQLPSGLDGTHDWIQFNWVWENTNFTKMKVLLNAGWVKDSLIGNATTWFDGIKVIPTFQHNLNYSGAMALPLDGQINFVEKIYEDGQYRICIRALSPSSQEVQVTFNNSEKSTITIPIEANSLDTFYSLPIGIKGGYYSFKIEAENPLFLDAIILFKVNDENETLPTVFGSNDNSVIITGIQRINPSKYLVSVNATKPFILTMAEAYDPLWVASVDGVKIGSAPFFNVINGFPINKTGSFDIVLEYGVQNMFYYGSAISLSALFVFFFAVIYNWKKKENSVLD